MSETFKHKLLASIRYGSVECPDAGSIQMLPYVCGKAMDIMIPDAENAMQLFEAFYEASAHEGSPDVSTLSASDLQTIAEYYCSLQDCREEFQQLVQANDVFVSFQRAFCSTEVWQQRDRDRRRLIRQIQLNTKTWASGIEQQMADAAALIRQMERIHIPVFPAIDLGDWVTEVESPSEHLRLSTHFVRSCPNP